MGVWIRAAPVVDLPMTELGWFDTVAVSEIDEFSIGVANRMFLSLRS